MFEKALTLYIAKSIMRISKAGSGMMRQIERTKGVNNKNIVITIQMDENTIKMLVIV